MKFYAKTLIALILSMSITGVQAQSMSDGTTLIILMGFLFVVALVMLSVCIVLLKLLKTLIRDQLVRQAGLDGEVAIEEPENWWSKFLTRANDAVPIEEEEAIVLDHNYDGIRELDNHLPPWWKWTFYFTIVFGVVYMGIYHVFDKMPLQTAEYQAEMELAEEIKLARLANQPVKQIDESNLVLVTDAAALTDGKKVFVRNCVQCHAEDGGGNIGPNLTDEYWLHGGGLTDIFVTIREGVPDKGMIPWGPLLSPEQIQNVTGYIMTFQGTTPVNPKAPQGELYIPVDSAEESDTTAISVLTE